MTNSKKINGDNNVNGKFPHPGDEWGDCPQGAVADVVRNVHAKRRHQSLRKAATLGGGMAAILMTVGLVYWSSAEVPPAVIPVQQPPAVQVRNISCREAIRQLPEYLAGRVDRETELRIDRHMRRCRRCRKHIPHDHPKAHLVAGLEQSPLLPFGVWPAAAR